MAKIVMVFGKEGIQLQEVRGRRYRATNIIAKGEPKGFRNIEAVKLP